VSFRTILIAQKNDKIKFYTCHGFLKAQLWNSIWLNHPTIEWFTFVLYYSIINDYSKYTLRQILNFIHDTSLERSTIKFGAVLHLIRIVMAFHKSRATLRASVSWIEIVFIDLIWLIPLYDLVFELTSNISIITLYHTTNLKQQLWLTYICRSAEPVHRTGRRLVFTSRRIK
jgi:hypothetical protein